MSTSTGSSPTSRSSRVACHEARDRFFQCVRDLGIDFKPGSDIPQQCKALRSAFEKGCPASWVQHFEEQQEAQARRTRFLHKVIGDQTNTAAGSLTGKPQN